MQSKRVKNIILLLVVIFIFWWPMEAMKKLVPYSLQPRGDFENFNGFNHPTTNGPLCIDPWNYALRQHNQSGEPQEEWGRIVRELEFVIDNGTEYQDLLIYKSDRPQCQDYILPEVDFSQQTLLGKYTELGGCPNSTTFLG